jgi:predicted nucleic acid-binding Zn ribbon protein
MAEGRSTWRPLRRRNLDAWEAVEPRPVRESLDRIAARLGAPGTDVLGAVFGQWESTVGATVAAHSRPLSLTRGTLVVAVDDPAWATQLRFLGATILERLEALVGGGMVERIEVRVRRF